MFMFYVYILQSIHSPAQQYVGYTEDLQQRLKEHNQGKSRHTSKFSPWKIVSYFSFANKETAQRFELYLKTGSGRAFLKRHLL